MLKQRPLWLAISSGASVARQSAFASSHSVESLSPGTLAHRQVEYIYHVIA
jgi:hypothetical protein